MPEVLYEERGPIAVITLNRPDQLNSFNRALRLATREAVLRAQANEAIRAVVVTGAGRGFCAGADLTEPPPDGPGVVEVLTAEYGPAVLALAQMPKISLAAVNGFAAGIGVGFALACDLVVMGEGSFMQVPFNRIGLVPDGGVCWQLVERLGHRRALEVSLEAERIAAARCVELGLANRVVPDEQVLAATMEWAGRVAAMAPIATRLTKRLLRDAATSSLQATIQAEAQAQSHCIVSEDMREGVTAFLQKRAPQFRGR